MVERPWRPSCAFLFLLCLSGESQNWAGGRNPLRPTSSLLWRAELFDSPLAPEELWGVAVHPVWRAIQDNLVDGCFKQVLFGSLLSNYMPHTVWGMYLQQLLSYIFWVCIFCCFVPSEKVFILHCLHIKYEVQNIKFAISWKSGLGNVSLV